MQFAATFLYVLFVRRAGLFGSYHVFIFLFLLSNTLTTGLWIFYIDTGITDIAQMSLLHAFGVSSSVMVLGIAASVLHVAYQKTQNTQIIIDTVMKTLVYGGFAWLVLFHQETQSHGLNPYKIYLFMDIFVFSTLVTLFISIKKRGISLSFWLACIAVGLYCVYGFLNAVFVSHTGSLLEQVNFISYNPLNTNVYFIIIFGAIYLLFLIASLVAKEDHFKDNSDVNIKRFKNLNFIFLILPIVASFFINKINFMWISFLVLLLIIHRILSYHISSIAHNKEIFQSEQRMHAKLDDEIQSHKNKLKEVNETLRNLSHFDSITGVLNRHWFIIGLSELITTKPLGDVINLYSIDINNFKHINDTYGHYIGDGALKITAQRLKDMLPKDAIIGRFGSDDILIAIRRAYNQNDRTEFATRLISEIKKPLVIEQRQLQISAKIGISSTTSSQISANDLLFKAEIALTPAKTSAGGFAYYCDEIHSKVLEETKIETLLENASFDDELSVLYQPVYAINDNTIIGVEALLRWQSPIKGEISPDIFIPIAEQSPMIIKLGGWVLQKVCKELSALNTRFDTNLSASVNIASRQAENINFTQEIFEHLKNNNIKPNWLNIEISEKNLSNAQDSMTPIIYELKNRGISVSIDNCGTGFVSIEFLKKYGIHNIKIARELIKELDLNPKNQKIVKAIISMAKKMRIQTTAVGVENLASLEILKEFGCDMIQGFILSKPLSLSELILAIRQSKTPQQALSIKAEIAEQKEI